MVAAVDLPVAEHNGPTTLTAATAGTFLRVAIDRTRTRAEAAHRLLAEVTAIESESRDPQDLQVPPAAAATVAVEVIVMRAMIMNGMMVDDE